MEIKSPQTKIDSAYSLLHGLIWLVLILNILAFFSIYNYLLFHVIAESFSIIVAYAIFILAWNSRAYIEQDYFLFIGISYLFIGSLDMLHMISYKGMNVFPGNDANMPTQFWIAARYLECFSLMGAFLFLKTKMNRQAVIGGFSFLTFTLIALITSGYFPACYLEGTGLTSFKKVSEYLISTVLILVIYILYKKRSNFDPKVFKWLTASIFFTICAELSFTFYISVYGLSNFVGHIFKLFSVYFIYKSIIETGLVRPYSILFRDLKKNEEK